MEDVEKIEKYLNERKEAILENFKTYLESLTQSSIKQLEAELSRIKEITKIRLPQPLNVLDILSNGGYVYSKVFINEYNGTDFNVRIGSYSVFDWGWGAPILGKGKYRVTLIIERLGENE